MLFCIKAAVTQSSTAPLCSIYPSASLFFLFKDLFSFSYTLGGTRCRVGSRLLLGGVCNACGGRGGEYVGMLFCKITHSCCLVPTIAFAGVFAQNFLTRVSWKSFEIANR